MNTPAEVLPESTAYLSIYFSGITGLLIYNMGSGILRAVGDSRRPFYFLVVSAVLNTGLDVADLQEFHGLIDEFGKAYRDDAAKNESFLQSWRPGEAAPRPTE